MLLLICDLQQLQNNEMMPKKLNELVNHFCSTNHHRLLAPYRKSLAWNKLKTKETSRLLDTVCQQVYVDCLLQMSFPLKVYFGATAVPRRRKGEQK